MKFRESVELSGMWCGAGRIGWWRTDRGESK